MGEESRRFLFAEHEPVNHIVYEAVRSLNGSISAEHGLGQLKRESVAQWLNLYDTTDPISNVVGPYFPFPGFRPRDGGCARNVRQR